MHGLHGIFRAPAKVLVDGKLELSLQSLHVRRYECDDGVGATVDDVPVQHLVHFVELDGSDVASILHVLPAGCDASLGKHSGRVVQRFAG